MTSFFLDLLFNRYTLIIVVLLGVVLAIGGLSGRILWNKYVISALVLLALGWGAYGWAFMAGETHQFAKDQPQIAKLEKQLSDYADAIKAAELAAKVQHDRQVADAATAAAAYESSRIAWEKTLKVTKHDLFVATENLASCKLNDAAIGLLNAAGSDDAKSP